MNTRGLLDQLLKSGQDLLQNKAGQSRAVAQQTGYSRIKTVGWVGPRRWGRLGRAA